MISNLEKYKKDLEELIEQGGLLYNAMQKECFPEEFEEMYKKALKEKYKDYVKKLPRFAAKYQDWYSESLALIKQLLPDRVENFTRHYEKPKTKRKDITYENYTIEDHLQGLRVTYLGDLKVGPQAAIPRFEQQLHILKSIKKRFESTLFDIKQLVQADLFDSELEAAKELAKKGFLRGAGAIAGVVLEKHLSQVCDNHTVKIGKKSPAISDYNDKLKNADVYETPTWRKIQHLGDLRNLCDHKKKKEPKPDDVEELIEGVEKITKTLF